MSTSPECRGSPAAVGDSADAWFTRRRVLAASAASLLPAYGQGATSFPGRAVRIIVPGSAGGSIDSVARIVSVQLGTVWNRGVIVETRPGANSAIGVSATTKAAADGHTLLVVHSAPLTLMPELYSKLPYEPSDLVPICQLAELPVMLYVANTEKAPKTIAELISQAKKSAGRWNCSYGGIAAFMYANLFKDLTGIEFVDVPYKGAAPSLLAVASGEADLVFADPASADPLVSGGRLRALGVASAKPIPSHPTVRAIADTVPGFAGESWIALFVRKGTPPELVDAITETVRTTVDNAEVKSRIGKLGIVPTFSNGASLAERILKERTVWRRLIQTRHITAPS